MTDYFSDATDYTSTGTTFVSENSKTMTVALNSVILAADADGGGEIGVFSPGNFVDEGFRLASVMYEAASFTITTAGYYNIYASNCRVGITNPGWDFSLYYSINSTGAQYFIGNLYDGGGYDPYYLYTLEPKIEYLNVGYVIRWFCIRNEQCLSGDFQPYLSIYNESIVGYTKNSTNASDVVTIGSDSTGSYVTKTLSIGNLAINDIIRFWIKSSAGGTSHMKNTKITAAYGNITFNTTPTSAGIYLDGSGTSSGSTNTTLSYIPAGDHNYLLKKARYSDVGGSATVTDGGTIIITKTLISTDSNFLQMF